MADLTTQHGRIDYLVEQHGPKAFIGAGLSATQLTRLRKGESDPSLSRAQRIADVAGVSLDWISTGKGDLAAGEGLAGYVAITPLADQPEAAKQLPVQLPETMLARRGIDAGQCALVVVVDDAMGPLREGDQVVIEKGARRRDGMFAIRMHGEVLLRRLAFSPDGSIELMCDSAGYPSHTLDTEQQKSIELIGRRVWSGSF